jgi:hypothetical protein
MAPVGWNFLYDWDSPHWLRTVWACIFDLPILIIFGTYFAYQAPSLVFLIIPLNSLILSWLIIKPILIFQNFRQTRQKQYLIQSSTFFGLSAALLGVIAILWIPSNILSQKEIAIAQLQQIDASVQQFEHTNSPSQKP